MIVFNIAIKFYAEFDEKCSQLEMRDDCMRKWGSEFLAPFLNKYSIA